ncbi:uncharacterized protein [Onthophagus taurus]|uniref:uncharacterized protein isoform X1 n=2 Tax=Onthophagus taurus TaxID=166361 RepID=UPI0039BE0B68
MVTFRDNSKQNQIRNMNKKQEQQLNREMLEKFWPWNKPVHPRGLGNLRMEEIFPDDELQKCKRLTGSLNLGKPGGGAPHRIRTLEDPLLRFQWNKDLRNAVENNIRYKKNRLEQEEYKKHLDKIVYERKKLKEKEKRDDLKQNVDLMAKTPPWGKPGPGGILWRQPKDIGLNFLQSMGWSDEQTLNQLDNDYKKLKPKEQFKFPSKPLYSKKYEVNKKIVDIKPYRLSPLRSCKGSGDDLVNLIAKKRYPPLIPLISTDITKEKRCLTYYIKLQEQNKNYLNELTKQMSKKLDDIKKIKEDDLCYSKMHFTTWNQFWGKPGHGAPKSVKKKGHLEKLLFPQLVSAV